MKRLFVWLCIGAISVMAVSAYANAGYNERKAEVIARMRGYKMPSQFLVCALMQVESDRGKTSDNILQLKRIYIRDVNRIYGTKFRFSDAFNYKKSVRITRLYLAYWGAKYEKATGLECTDEVFARMHNGGPNGYKKWKTKFYWYRVKKAMREV